MRILYNNTFKISKKEFTQFHADIREAILFIDLFELAQVKVDRIKGINDVYGITIFLPLKKEILSLHGEGTSLTDALNAVYQEIYKYKENGFILMNSQHAMFAA